MAKTEVTVSLDEGLVSRALAKSDDLAEKIEVTLRRHLDDDAADHRWAEENALLVEALAGGAAETA